MTSGAQPSGRTRQITGSRAALAERCWQSQQIGLANRRRVSATVNTVVTFSTVVALSVQRKRCSATLIGDGTVNCCRRILTIVKNSFGTHLALGQTGFNSAADLNNDGTVNILDLFIVSRQLAPRYSLSFSHVERQGDTAYADKTSQIRLHGYSPLAKSHTMAGTISVQTCHSDGVSWPKLYAECRYLGGQPICMATSSTSDSTRPF